jgi:predicted phosphodiesterase
MKIAILSDIHSNVYALEAVLQDAKLRECTTLANLGDILYGPISPRDTYDLLLENKFLTISGNQDRQIYESTPAEISSNPTMQFILDDLGDEPLAWMRSLPFDMQVNTGLYFCHGTPTNDLIYLLEDVSSGAAQLRSDDEIHKLLAGQKTKLICCGHTHTPRLVKLSSGSLVLNPGSVGLQAYTDEEPVVHSMENYCDLASYAVAEIQNGKWVIEHVRVPYDVASAVEKCLSRGREDWAHFLETGRRVA